MFRSFDMKFFRRNQKSVGMVRLYQAILLFLVKPDRLHIMANFLANSTDPDQTAPRGAV